jgi:ureidoglycolate amidohydrolase
MDHSGIPIGIVTAIAAPASLKVGFKGDGGHAGAVLMPVRNDAGLAGAELALSVEKNVLASGSTDTVGTTGVFKIHPGAVNSVPRESHLEIDIRDIDEKRRDKVVDEIKRSAHEIAGRRRVTLTKFEIVNQDPPAQSGDQVVGAAIQAAELLGLEYQTMVSRAYHDSLFMARIAPMGMIFIPCYKGYSHRPDEFASLEDMTKGVQVLSLTLKRLSSL